MKNNEYLEKRVNEMVTEIFKSGYSDEFLAYTEAAQTNGKCQFVKTVLSCAAIGMLAVGSLRCYRSLKEKQDSSGKTKEDTEE